MIPNQDAFLLYEKRLSRTYSRLIAYLLAFLCLSVISLHSPQVISSAYAEQLSAKKKAQRSFKQGRVAYNQGHFEASLRHFEEAYRTYPLPLMLFNIASVYERLGLLPLAIEKYKAFIASGKDKRGEGAAKVSALEKKISGWVDAVITTDASVEVRYGGPTGPELGTTPLTLTLPPNRPIDLYLIPRSGQSFTKTITLSDAPKLQRVKVKLTKQSAFVRVIGSPPQAEVRIGDIQAKGLPALIELTVGDHEIELLSPGYLPTHRSISLTSVHSRSAPLTLEVDLRTSEGVGLIALQVESDGTLLFIDGQPAGQSPFSEPLELPEGDHLIELKGPKGEQYSEQVNLKTGQTVNIDVSFDQASSLFTTQHISYGLMGVGGVSLITGIVLGAVALNTSNSLEDCRAHDLCARRQGELDRADAVRVYALSADILIGLGAALGAAGGVLYWLNQGSTPSIVPGSTDVQVSPTVGGLMIDGRIAF